MDNDQKRLTAKKEPGKESVEPDGPIDDAIPLG